MTPTGESRRAFLESLGRHGAAGTLLAAAAVESRRGYAANDTLNVGCIGTGGRCRTLMKPLAQVPGVRLAAVCDVYDPHLDLARKLADPSALATRRFPELLDRKDIDAVLIGTPDHWHVPITVAACMSGKDVYVEKPLTHDPSEGAAAIDVQNRHQRIVQVGTQQRSMPHFQKARDLLKAGRIGTVLKVHMSWNRNAPVRNRESASSVQVDQLDWKAFLGTAPDQAVDRFRFRNWRWFWDFGGGLLTDLMVHWIDVAHWFLDLDHPQSATTAGVHFAAQGLWETPDTIQTLLAYPGNLQAHFEGTFSNAFHGAMIAFMGTEATLYLDRGRYEIYPERGKGETESLVLGTEPRRGRDFYDNPNGELLHLTNWIACVRSRQRPNCPAEAGAAAAAAAHLANQAYRTGQVAQWS
jgi:predicted dehydrogenase